MSIFHIFLHFHQVDCDYHKKYVLSLFEKCPFLDRKIPYGAVNILSLKDDFNGFKLKGTSKLKFLYALEILIL